MRCDFGSEGWHRTGDDRKAGPTAGGEANGPANEVGAQRDHGCGGGAGGRTGVSAPALPAGLHGGQTTGRLGPLRADLGPCSGDRLVIVADRITMAQGARSAPRLAWPVRSTAEGPAVNS